MVVPCFLGQIWYAESVRGTFSTGHQTLQTQWKHWGLVDPEQFNSLKQSVIRQSWVSQLWDFLSFLQFIYFFKRSFWCALRWSPHPKLTTEKQPRARAPPVPELSMPKAQLSQKHLLEAFLMSVQSKTMLSILLSVFSGLVYVSSGKLSTDNKIALEAWSKKPSLTLWSSFLSGNNRPPSPCYCRKPSTVLCSFDHQLLILVLFTFHRQALDNNKRSSKLLILVENPFISDCMGL